MSDSSFPSALARNWVERYAEYLCLVIALRELVRRGAGRGAVRGLVTARATALLETADGLAAFGLRPALGLAGAEADVWGHTVRYAAEIPWQSPPAGVPLADLTADLARMQAAWDRFEAAVGNLPADFCETCSVLAPGAAPRGEELATLFVPRVRPTAIV